MREVPKATVVITNPTHLAVALRYDRATMASPRLVAKGAGLVAERILEEARRHQVPIVRRIGPQLCRKKPPICAEIRPKTPLRHHPVATPWQPCSVLRGTKNAAGLVGE